MVLRWGILRWRLSSGRVVGAAAEGSSRFERAFLQGTQVSGRAAGLSLARMGSRFRRRSRWSGYCVAAIGFRRWVYSVCKGLCRGRTEVCSKRIGPFAPVPGSRSTAPRSEPCYCRPAVFLVLACVRSPAVMTAIEGTRSTAVDPEIERDRDERKTGESDGCADGEAGRHRLVEIERVAEDDGAGDEKGCEEESR